VKRMILATILCILAAGRFLCGPSASSSNAGNDNEGAQQAYRAYVKAWKLKDLAALRNLIADDYMAVNFEGKVSDRENEISTAKADPEWLAMTVDEIHTRIFGNTAIASSFISAQGKRQDGNIFNAKVRFLAAPVKPNLQRRNGRPSGRPARNDVRRP
jgi:ketosteroid isomerase-like protein